MLVDAGAPSDVVDEYRGTPLFQASARGHSPTVEVLLAAGADPNRPVPIDLLGVGVFVYSLEPSVQAAVVAALGPAIGLDPRLAEGFVPGEEAEGLLNALANLGEGEALTDELGEVVPLYASVVRGDITSVRALLDAGANPSLGFGPHEHSSLDAARELGRDGLVALLERSALVTP
jgi:ankyrin repeat protein